MDVWTYFSQKERELRELSLAPEGTFGDMVAEEEGSYGTRGRSFGNAILTEHAYLSIHEVVVVVNDHDHREEYGYFLVIGGEEIWGYERDPSHDPPVHRHTTGHQRHPGEAIPFKEVAERAWREVTERAERGELRL